jgi:3-phosphoshikimate 1-carboxyvinyltransferase
MLNFKYIAPNSGICADGCGAERRVRAGWAGMPTLRAGRTTVQENDLKLVVERSSITGQVQIPGSKSATIRALAIASLADGESTILQPLDSADTRSAVAAYGALGAEIQAEGTTWRVNGVAGQPRTPRRKIDVGNSGTTLYFVLASAALAKGTITIDGDEQTRRRTALPLIGALKRLGVTIEAHGTKTGCAPITVKGRMKGGETIIACPTSQYLSSLLISCPLARNDTYISVTELNERPYVEMTLDWLNRQDIQYTHDNMQRFEIMGGQNYQAFQERVPADFSSSAFFFGAAAITGDELTLNGLDMNDSQGDKAIVGMLAAMGAEVDVQPGSIRIKGGRLRGGEFDLNATPDLLPIMSVVGCFAEGETRMVNVPQARIKETDRISVMREVLSALGGDVAELPDGLIVRHSPLRGGKVSGHGDHRVVMALAVGGLASAAPTEIDTAESVAITFPNFVELMEQVGVKIVRQ